MHLFHTYQVDEEFVPLIILDQALDHLHLVHKIPNYSKHPEEKAKSIVIDQNTEKHKIFTHRCPEVKQPTTSQIRRETF